MFGWLVTEVRNRSRWKLPRFAKFPRFWTQKIKLFVDVHFLFILHLFCPFFGWLDLLNASSFFLLKQFFSWILDIFIPIFFYLLQMYDRIMMNFFWDLGIFVFNLFLLLMNTSFWCISGFFFASKIISNNFLNLNFIKIFRNLIILHFEDYDVFFLGSSFSIYFFFEEYFILIYSWICYFNNNIYKSNNFFLLAMFFRK